MESRPLFDGKPNEIFHSIEYGGDDIDDDNDAMQDLCIYVFQEVLANLYRHTMTILKLLRNTQRFLPLVKRKYYDIL